MMFTKMVFCGVLILFYMYKFAICKKFVNIKGKEKHQRKGKAQDEFVLNKTETDFVIEMTFKVS